jgi:hypothetical protein
VAFWLWLIAMAGWLVSGSQVAGADKLDLSPVEWEAVTVSKLLAYIGWPEATTNSASGKLVFGILGKDPFGGMLGELFRGTKVNGQEVEVKVIDPGAGPVQCDVLFIPPEYNETWKELAKSIDPLGKLTIGASDDFTQNKGVFNLRVRERQLVINMKNLKRAGLTLNTKLLRVAIAER